MLRSFLFCAHQNKKTQHSSTVHVLPRACANQFVPRGSPSFRGRFLSAQSPALSSILRHNSIMENNTRTTDQLLLEHLSTVQNTRQTLQEMCSKQIIHPNSCVGHLNGLEQLFQSSVRTSDVEEHLLQTRSFGFVLSYMWKTVHSLVDLCSSLVSYLLHGSKGRLSLLDLQ